MLERNLFILCADAFSGHGGATPRFIQIASALQSHNWRTTVMRARVSSRQSPDQHGFPGSIICTPFPAGCWPAFLDRKGLRMLCRKAIFLFGKGSLLQDPKRGWAARITEEKFINSLPCTPDAILGVTFGSVDSLWAAKVLAEKMNRPLLLEFQDPCPSPHKHLNIYEQHSLAECMEHSRAAITTTRSYASILKQQYPACAGKIFPVHMAYEYYQAAPTPIGQKNQIIFLHAGALYGKNQRNANAFLLAMKRAFDKDPAAMGKVCFRLLGGWVGARDAKVLAKKLKIQHVLQIHDAVPYADSIRAMEIADVLVVIKFSDPAYATSVPGKLFQYFGRSKPILGIMGECEAAQMIRDSGLGKTYEHGDIDGISEFILRYVKHPEALRTDFKPNNVFINQFSLRYMGEKFDAILSEAIRSFGDS